MSKPTGVDESWGRANWDQLKAAGIKVVSLYFSRDPSKNAKPADIVAAHKHGMGVLLNWESQSGAPLLGAIQGSLDAKDWLLQRNALFKAVGYTPRNPIVALFSCDRDTTPANYPAIDAYFAATAAMVRPAGSLNGVYGEYDLINHLHAKGLTDVEWQTYAWSGGRLSPEADFYQYLNGQQLGGGSVDFDRVIHASTLGAWWPPGISPTPAPTPSPIAQRKDRDMFVYQVDPADMQNKNQGNCFILRGSGPPVKISGPGAVAMARSLGQPITITTQLEKVPNVDHVAIGGTDLSK